MAPIGTAKCGSFPVRDGLGIWLFRQPSSLMCLPLFWPLNHHETANSKTAKIEQKTQKNRINRRLFCEIWSE